MLLKLKSYYRYILKEVDHLLLKKTKDVKKQLPGHVYAINLTVIRDGLFVGTFCGEQGWCSGESARLPPMCPGFDSRTRRHMWAEFVGSLLCSERFFSGNSGFPLSSKTNI